MMHYYGYSGSWIHLIGMAFFWLVVIGLVVYLIKQIANDNSTGNNRKTSQEAPEEIAKKRYARGEISQEEYKEIITELKGKNNQK